MPLELRQIMVDTAITDAERLRQLVEDFLTLSRLESGRVTLMPEAISLQECVSLALSSLSARRAAQEVPEIESQVTEALPLVRADGEWLIQVIAKLLDNACKFTEATGKILIQAQLQSQLQPQLPGQSAPSPAQPKAQKKNQTTAQTKPKKPKPRPKPGPKPALNLLPALNL